MRKLVLALSLLFLGSQAFAVCSPIGGLGTIMEFNNNGVPIPNGVLYSFVAGTSTQQATFTDSTCTVQNNNPITMTSGGRATIWLTSTLLYKFQLCIQNDGASCAPADVLFSVDNVPGGPAGQGSPFIGTFISGSANPASTGILELASADSICWRNQANTLNLCISKDTSDVLGWNGGDVKFTEINCAATAAGFDYLCADTTLHRWTMFNNGGTKTQVVGAGVDINNSDQVTGLHFGAQAAPLSGVALVPGQSLVWNGTNIVGAVPSIVVANAGVTGTTTNTLTKLTGAPSTAVIAATTDVGGIVGITTSGAGIAGSANIAQIGIQACVFDGATTAGDYVQISATTPGNCHDAGSGNSATGQVIGRVLSTNGGSGTYSIDLFPPEITPRTMVASSRTINTGTVIGAANTTWVTKAVTMPVSGCPCRALVSYGVFFASGNSGTAVFWVEDGTSNFATSQVMTATAGGNAQSANGTESSPTTYANSAVITFLGRGNANTAGSITVGNPAFGSSENSWLNVTIFTSN